MVLKLIAAPIHPLSARQYEVVMLYGDGYTYRQIAERLELAYHTVKRHMEEARMQLKVSSAAEAYRIIRRMERNAA